MSRESRMIAHNLESAVALLNGLLLQDPEGISNFFWQNTLVNSDCANTPFELMESTFNNKVVLVPLGLLNGLVAEQNEEGEIVRRVAIQYANQSNRIQSFYIEEITDVKCSSEA